jgi:F-type H+-transporting ATPase subunit gamma
MSETSLVSLKRRIKSIKNTQKITRAMGLVATSKLRKVSSKLLVNNQFYRSFSHTIDQLITYSSNIDNKYFECSKCKKKLYIVFSSDLGLCGSFNGNVFQKLLKEIAGNEKNCEIITIGQKARGILKKNSLESVAEFVDISDVPEEEDADIIASKIFEIFDSCEFGEVYCIYTKYFTPVKQEVLLKKLLPIEKEKEPKETIKTSFEFEPEEKEFLNNISHFYIKQCIYNFFLNSRASEQGARMSAMDAANKNGNDIIDKLQLKYNRIRQSAITEAIAEIVSGAEAQK